ncbi:hypothetical protein ACP4OV_009898 [Aristida adscensionis]
MKSTAAMIKTTTDIWSEIIEEDGKLKRYENKRFPLFESLDQLCEGQIAEGKHCFTSSKPPDGRSKSVEVGSKNRIHLDFTKKNPWDIAVNVGGPDSEGLSSSLRTVDEYERQHVLENELLQQKGQKKKRSYQQRMEETRMQDVDSELLEDRHEGPQDISDDDAQKSDEHESSRSGPAGSNRGRPKKTNDTKPVPRVEETISKFLSFKKRQAAAKEQKKQEAQDYSITRCLEVLRAMDDMSDEIKINASDVFKDAMNWEIFLGYESRIRSLWLKKELDMLGTRLSTS